VSSLFSKEFEKLLLLFIVSKCLVGSKQLGFRALVGCATAHRIIRTILWRASAKGCPVFACSVDISVAFDRILHSQALLSCWIAALISPLCLFCSFDIATQLYVLC
jgi:hypothetical protein